MDYYTKLVGSHQSVYLKLFLLRLSSVFLVQTWFVPDEYWQSLEVAHKISFGYGYLTWEWNEGIRSLVHPLVFALFFKHVENLNIDNTYTLVYIPSILQALLTAFAEWSLCDAVAKRINQNIFPWFAILELLSWYMFYVGARTLGNTLEMSLILLGISYFIQRYKGPFIFCVLISCYLRPTCGSFWLIFVFHFLYIEAGWIFSKDGIATIIKCCAPLGLIICLDSWWYGRWIIVPLEFLEFNFFNNFSQFYGEHPWHWYFTNALPTLIGPLLIPVFMTIRFIIGSKQKGIFFLLILSSTLYIISHSLVPHKEIRFLTPLVPLMNLLAAFTITKLGNWWKTVIFIILLLWNIPLGWYLSLRHQRGVLDVVSFLETQITSQDSVLFLMPCHSTPLYSHLHVNASLRFLTCPPNLSQIDDYVDEADRFYMDPMKWLSGNVQEAPDFVVLYDVLVSEVSRFLNVNCYRLVHNFFHTDFPESRTGKYVLLFQKPEF